MANFPFFKKNPNDKDWYVTDFTKNQIEGYVANLEERIKRLKDQVYSLLYDKEKGQ